MNSLRQELALAQDKLKTEDAVLAVLQNEHEEATKPMTQPVFFPIAAPGPDPRRREPPPKNKRNQILVDITSGEMYSPCLGVMTRMTTGSGRPFCPNLWLPQRPSVAPPWCPEWQLCSFRILTPKLTPTSSQFPPSPP